MFYNIFCVDRFKTTDAGAYRVCFDNTHTRYSKKSIVLRMSAKDTAGTGTNWEQYNESKLEPEGDYGGRAREIVVSFIKFFLLDDVSIYNDNSPFNLFLSGTD